MAATGKLTVVSVILMCILMITSQHGEGAMSCSTVVNAVDPCYNYVKNGGDVPAACCNGIKSLNSAAKTKSDRQSVCTCLKSMVDNIASLPSKCGVDVPYKMDCSKVPMV